MTDERFSLKDHLFNEDKIAYLGSLLDSAIPGFDRPVFEETVMGRLPDLELKQRIGWIAEVLADHLDGEFEVAAGQIRSALPPPLDPTLSDDDFGDFIIAPFGRYVEEHGLDHYETSIALFHDLTMRFSMEGSIRPFINRRPDETLDRFGSWAEDENYHVRRLVSESTRPRLPWAPRIDLDIRAPLPLLDMLHKDPTRYVTRSVANHLNDIAKIEPRLVIDTLTRWQAEDAQDPDELDWMTRHSLRTLVKKGDPSAMTLLGFSPEPKVRVGPVAISTPTVRGGETLEFTVTLTADEAQPLMIDYVIDFVKKNGETGPKVFKLQKLDLAEGEATVLSKRHPLRSDATTYRLYPGTHRVAVVVNGQVFSSAEFEVRTD